MEQTDTPCSIKSVRGRPGLKFVSYNIRSIFNKLDPASIALLTGEFNCVSFQETWLDANIPNSFLAINGYNIYRQDRSFYTVDGTTVKKGGGLLTFVKDNITVDCTKFLEFNCNNDDLEMFALELSPKNHKKMVLVNLYRPPSGNLENALVKLGNLLSQLNNHSNRDILCLGDYNVNIGDNFDAKSIELLNLIEQYSLSVSLKQITREESGTSLDFFLTKMHHISQVCTLDLHLSDHLPIILIKKKNKGDTVFESFKGRCYRNYTFEKMKNFLENKPAIIVDRDCDPNVIWNTMYGNIVQAADRICPMKIFTKRKRNCLMLVKKSTN